MATDVAVKYTNQDTNLEKKSGQHRSEIRLHVLSGLVLIYTVSLTVRKELLYPLDAIYGTILSRDKDLSRLKSDWFL